MEEVIKEGYTRVTRVLEPYNNFENILPSVLQHATQRGTHIHNLCDLYANGYYFPTPSGEIRGYVDSFAEWFDMMVDEVLFTERRFYDDLYRITGAVDLIAVLKGDKYPTIIDYKTPATESKSWALQLAAYQHIAYDEDVLEIKRRAVLQLRKDGSPAKLIEYRGKHDWTIYEGILRAHRYFNK